MHAVFWYNWYYDDVELPGIWRSKGDNNCTIDEVYVHVDQLPLNVHFINTSASSNDVYVIWQDDDIGDSLRLIYDDATPLQPQDLAVESYEEAKETYAKLTWTFNNEPDVRINDDGYLMERRTKPSGGSWSAWTQIATVGGATSQYIDYDITNIGADAFTAEYRIRAKDLNNNISSYSSTVSITFGKFAKIGSGALTYDYELRQNFPNPFNPSTRIDYSIKNDGLVTLKIYDVLGKEVATLVNERKSAGHHSVEFNGANLPSGIYIYKLTSDPFSTTKKLILLK